jgi:hypothetical protein
MKVNIITGVVAIGLALGTAAAFAQTQTGSTGQGSAYNPNIKPPQDHFQLGGAQSQEGPSVVQYDKGNASAQKPPSIVGQYDQGSAAAKKTPNQ